MLVGFFAATFRCRANFLWREPVELAVDTRQSVWQIRANPKTKCTWYTQIPCCFFARILHTESDSGHCADLSTPLLRHTTRVKTKKIAPKTLTGTEVTACKFWVAILSFVLPG